VLFETGCTRSTTRTVLKTTPPVDLVLGNADMRGSRFWFDLREGKAWVDETGDRLLQD